MSLLGYEPLSLKRPAPRAWVAGEPAAESLAAPVPFQGSVQPLRPHEVQQLPEGERTLEQWWCFTQTELRAADQSTSNPADVVEGQGGLQLKTGVEYRVMAATPWQHLGVPHYRARLQRITPA